MKGIQFDKLAEGEATLEALQRLGDTYNVDLPICNALYKIIIKGDGSSEIHVDYL